MSFTPRILAACLFAACASPVARAQEAVLDALPAPPLHEGDVIGFSDVDRLRSYIPEPFWEHREFFFFEGMQLRIGPVNKDFSPTQLRNELTEKYRGQARIGPDGSLENYSLGQPFPDISPDDPEAGVKHAWNRDYGHDALEGKASFYFTYWDNGDQLPLWYKGNVWVLRLSRRSDKADGDGAIFRQERRKGAGKLRVSGPPDSRGITGVGYRYQSMDGPRDQARSDDIWVYVPDLRRVRRFTSNRDDAIAGTDMTPDDGGGFSGIVPEFEWEYVGETDVLSPIDTTIQGYPHSEDANFGPTGLSLANDEWQIRRAIILEMKPKDDDHIYTRKRLWIDKQTYSVLYAAAYDRYGELWKLIQSAYRWSESELQDGKLRDLRTLFRKADILVNVRTGTGNRVEFFDSQATRLRRGQIRKLLDPGRLGSKGR